MSVLDMFASALGAFIMICVILFPYYNQRKQLDLVNEKTVKAEDDTKKEKAELSESRGIKERQQEEIRKGSEFRTSLTACERKASACTAALTSAFLVVGMEWEDSCDVDLHVTDPKQREFYYSNRTHPLSKAELSIDMVDGPGIEVWQNPEAETGDYAIKYQKMSCPSVQGPLDSIVVKGWVLDRSSGIRALPDVVLTNGRSLASVAVLRLSSDGFLTIQASRE